MDVNLVIIGVNTDPDGQTETVRQQACGRLQQRDDCWYLHYPDAENGGTATIKASAERVVLLRSGSGGTRLEIRPGVRKVGRYATPYGELELGVTGRAIRLELGELGGLLAFQYELDAGESPLGDHQVTIEIKSRPLSE